MVTVTEMIRTLVGRGEEAGEKPNCFFCVRTAISWRGNGNSWPIGEEPPLWLVETVRRGGGSVQAFAVCERH